MEICREKKGSSKFVGNQDDFFSCGDFFRLDDGLRVEGLEEDIHLEEAAAVSGTYPVKDLLRKNCRKFR